MLLVVVFRFVLLFSSLRNEVTVCGCLLLLAKFPVQGCTVRCLFYYTRYTGKSRRSFWVRGICSAECPRWAPDFPCNLALS